ncbi:MAG: class I SAM-dependent methyltransferase, partial [Bacteroidota bacterium]
MNPQYSDAHLTEYYSRFTFEEPEWDEPLLYCHDFYLSLVERFHPQQGRILDIGAGKGHLLLAAKKRGWDPLGYDVDCESERLISKKIGIDILCGDFFTLDLKPESFDA